MFLTFAVLGAWMLGIGAICFLLGVIGGLLKLVFNAHD